MKLGHEPLTVEEETQGSQARPKMRGSTPHCVRNCAVRREFSQFACFTQTLEHTLSSLRMSF